MSDENLEKQTLDDLIEEQAHHINEFESLLRVYKNLQRENELKSEISLRKIMGDL